MSEKMWGSEPFWGLGYEWDPDWVLTDRQKELRALLIELCEKEMRANAKRSDDELLFPRRNLELLGEHGFLGLDRPRGVRRPRREPRRLLDGLRDDRALRLRVDGHVLRDAHRRGDGGHVPPHQELIEKYIRPLRSGKIGTLSYSDPETGSHFWYPISSGAERSNGGYKVRKKASWTTSPGSPTSTSCRRRAPTSRATTTSRCSSSTPSTSSRSRRCGTRSACAATSPARSRCRAWRSPARS